MASYTSIQDRSYIVVKGGATTPPDFTSPILATCLDTQGNTIKRTTIEVDASAGAVNVMLPSIASLSNDLDCRIDIIIQDNTNKINILSNVDLTTGTPSGDVIGQTTDLNIAGSTYTAGAVLTLTPAYEGYWSLNETIN